MIMKVIFLDIDGVLNSREWLMSGECEEPNNYDEMWKHLSPEHVERLSDIIDATNAKIVLSSSWRMWTTNEKMIDHLNKRLKRDWPFIGQTDRKSQTWDERALLIKKWLGENPKVVQYVILEDETGHKHYKEFHSGHFIEIDFNTGLTEKAKDEAIEILNK